MASPPLDSSTPTIASFFDQLYRMKDEATEQLVGITCECAHSNDCPKKNVQSTIEQFYVRMVDNFKMAFQEEYNLNVSNAKIQDPIKQVTAPIECKASQSRPKQKGLPCPYAECKRRFDRKTDLQVHVRNHRGLKPFECQWPDCNFASASLKLTQGHIRAKHFKVPTSLAEQKRRGMTIDNDQNVINWIGVDLAQAK